MTGLFCHCETGVLSSVVEDMGLHSCWALQSRSWHHMRSCIPGWMDPWPAVWSRQFHHCIIKYRSLVDELSNAWNKQRSISNITENKGMPEKMRCYFHNFIFGLQTFCIPICCFFLVEINLGAAPLVHIILPLKLLSKFDARGLTSTVVVNPSGRIPRHFFTRFRDFFLAWWCKRIQVTMYLPRQ